LIGPQGPSGFSGYQIVTASGTAALTSGMQITTRVLCPVGKKVLGGGLTQTTPAGFALSLTLVSSFPDTNASWLVAVRNNESFSLPSVTVTAYAICSFAN
jgi:hypothetical protein